MAAMEENTASKMKGKISMGIEGAGAGGGFGLNAPGAGWFQILLRLRERDFQPDSLTQPSHIIA